MNYKANCAAETSDKIIVYQENRSKLIINNPRSSTVTKVIVDGCEITSGIRCDFLVVKDKYEYFIELKGHDLDHAISQIKESIRLLSDKKTPKTCLIVCHRSPLSASKIQNLQSLFKKQLSAKLIIKSSPHTIDI